MNDHPIRNGLKIAVSYALFYTGLLHVLTRSFVRRGLLIFNYHGFSTFANDYWDFGSLYTSGYGRNFEKQVRYFERHFRKLTDFSLTGTSGGRPAYLLTFDDGYRDNFEIALPVLVKHAVPSIFFIATGAIGTDRLLWYDAVRRRYESIRPRGRWAAARLKRKCKEELEQLKRIAGHDGQPMMPIPPGPSPRLMMNWDEVRGAEASGVLIGAHTGTHPILSRLSSDSQRREIQTSLETIKRETGRCPEFFSYPEGDAASFDDETVRILKETGVSFAVTTEQGLNDVPEAAPYLLKRTGLNPSDPVPVVALKIALIGLKKRRRPQGSRGRTAQVQSKVRQYGFRNAAKRACKAALRIIGFHIETYWILNRGLDSPVEAPDPVSGLIVKQLSLGDFEASPFFREFLPEKKDLIERRFSSPEYQAFGAERDGELVYTTWIATDSLRIEAIHFEQELEPGEAVLLDSLTLPKARGLGIHTYMSWYRLERLRDRGIRRAFVAVLAENRPALKALRKVGFETREKLTWLKWGRLNKIFRRRVSPQQGGRGIGAPPGPRPIE